jgi:hypothetical protein
MGNALLIMGRMSYLYSMIPVLDRERIQRSQPLGSFLCNLVNIRRQGQPCIENHPPDSFVDPWIGFPNSWTARGLRKRFPTLAKIIVELCEELMVILHSLQPPF